MDNVNESQRRRHSVRLSGGLVGQLATEDGPASFIGHVVGELDPVTGEVSGEASGMLATAAGWSVTDLCMRLQGCLEPLRAVQVVHGGAIGGVTAYLRLPGLRGQCIPQG